jgi:hypothetical protein
VKTEVDLQADSDLRELMATAPGRRFLWRLVEGWCGTYGSSFSGEQAALAAFTEGRRWVGIKVMEDCLRVAPASWVKLLTETFEQREIERLSAEAAEQKEQG